MKLVSYVVKADELNIQSNNTAGARLGWIDDDFVVDAVFAQRWLAEEKGVIYSHEVPSDLISVLDRGPHEISILQDLQSKLQGEDFDKVRVEGEPVAIKVEELQLLSPLPEPSSLRDFYAFESHVKTARKKRGLEMVPQWYEAPVFYFSNHHSVIGLDAVIEKPSYTKCLDFELEVACVIGQKGIDIKREEALDYVAGFTIMNDWSARDIQSTEMKVGLGPAKGKDFATSLGPYLVTLDELEDRREGEMWDLKMTAKVNDKQVSSGNMKDLYWSFSQMIEQASKGVELRPGDVIGSGTVGTGCILELGEEVCCWLQPGDVVELEVERMGVLRNAMK